MSIATELREAAMGPNLGMWLSAWLPMYRYDAFMFAYEAMPCGRSFPLLDVYERRMFLLFLSYAAEDEGV